MDFFEHQEAARRSTRVLVLFYALAVIGVVIAVDLVVAVIYVWGMTDFEAPAGATPGLLSQFFTVPSEVYIYGALVTLAIIFIVSLVRVARLADGGDAVARLVGARAVDPGTRDPLERRLLNVVEEMAIASGVRVPKVYVMDKESVINAFAAGWSVSSSVVAVTRGTLETLNRDELQGVVGHEFSHILNGDMRLNISMLGVLAGIVFIGAIGEFFMRNAAEADDIRAAVPIFAAGLSLLIIGYIGLFFARLIKAAVSRQREFLADASSVQFTRNPDGIAGALDQINASARGTVIANRFAEDMSHMFFGQSVRVWMAGLFDTHPPLDERIRRVNPRFQRTSYRTKRPPVEAPASAPAEASGFAAGAPGLGDAQWGAALAAPGDARIAAASAAVIGTIGRPSAQHIDYAAALLQSLPADFRTAIRTPQGAKAAVCSLLISAEPVVRERQRAAFAEAGDAEAGAMAFLLVETVEALGKQYRLPLVDLAIPALKTLSQDERERLLKLVAALIAADRRMTVDEFVLEVLLHQQLRKDAARAEKIRYNAMKELAPEAVLVLSLVAYAGSERGDATAAATAFAKGAPRLRLPSAPEILPAGGISLASVREALGKLRLLAPLQKPAIVMACLDAALADEKIRVSEAELMRALCAAVDCPLPPVIGTAALSA